MTKDLNIRAAKCLGWYLKKTQPVNTWFDAEGCVFKPNRGGRIYKNELNFTTSYDWAMLGVKYLLNIKKVLSDGSTVNWGRDKMLEIYQNKITCWFYEATPEQITQAWVEALEGEKGE